MSTRSIYPVVYQINEVARIFKLTPRAVRELIRAGEIPAIRLGRHYRVPRTVIDSFFAQATLKNFSPEDLGFGIWKAKRGKSDSSAQVNRMRDRDRRTLKQIVAELKNWND